MSVKGLEDSEGKCMTTFYVIKLALYFEEIMYYACDK